MPMSKCHLLLMTLNLWGNLIWEWKRESSRKHSGFKKNVYIYIYKWNKRKQNGFSGTWLGPPFAKTSRKLWVVFVWCSHQIGVLFIFWIFLMFFGFLLRHCFFSKVNYEFKGKAFSWHPLSLCTSCEEAFSSKQSLFFEAKPLLRSSTSSSHLLFYSKSISLYRPSSFLLMTACSFLFSK